MKVFMKSVVELISGRRMLLVVFRLVILSLPRSRQMQGTHFTCTSDRRVQRGGTRVGAPEVEP